MLSQEQYRKDAEVLRKAMAGWGTDEDPIIEISSRRSNADRQAIIKEYKTLYGRDAIADLEDELGGDLGRTIQAMYKTPLDYDCSELYKAMKGAGTDEDTLIEIIGSRPNSVLKEIIKRYKELYNLSLEEHVSSETSGDLKRLLVSLLQCNRSEERNIDTFKLDQDLQKLYDAGEGQWGTDESVFNQIFATRSPTELDYLNTKYSEHCGKSLFKVIDSEFGGDMAQLLKTVLMAQINPPEFFADRIYQACKGLGTNDKILIRVLVSRDEIDLKTNNKVYIQKYHKTLLEQIKDECSGDYKNLLLAIVKT
jgi:annexin A7/11